MRVVKGDWNRAASQYNGVCVLEFYVTCNDISVIYVTAQMCRRIEKELSCTYGRAPNAIDIS